MRRYRYWYQIENLKPFTLLPTQFAFFEWPSVSTGLSLCDKGTTIANGVSVDIPSDAEVPGAPQYPG